MHRFPTGKEGQREVGNIMGWMTPLEAVILEKVWMMITSDNLETILRLKEPL